MSGTNIDTLSSLPTSSLPRPSLLQKIEAQYPGAAQMIMTRAEELQKQSFANDRFAQQHNNKQKNKQSGLRAILNHLIKSPAAIKNHSDPQALQQTWEQVGYYIKYALHDFIKDNDIDITTLNLNDEEKKDLNLSASPSQRALSL